MNEKSTTVRIIRWAATRTSAIAPGLAARGLAQLFTMPQRPTRPKREQAWLASAQTSTLYLEPHRKIPIYSWGAGPTVLLVHGWSGRGSQLGAFAALLRARGYRVVTFDAPAHGDADGRFTALPELAATIGRVARHVGPVHAIVSHSMGAAATTLALARGLQVQRLVYIAPPEDLPGYLASLARTLGFSPAVAQRTQRRLERRYGVPFEQARGGTLAPRMTTPLLVVHDEDDTEVPLTEGQRIAQRWPGAVLKTTRGLGHRRILRAPTVLRTVADFMTGEPLDAHAAR